MAFINDALKKDIPLGASVVTAAAIFMLVLGVAAAFDASRPAKIVHIMPAFGQEQEEIEAEAEEHCREYGGAIFTEEGRFDTCVLDDPAEESNRDAACPGIVERWLNDDLEILPADCREYLPTEEESSEEEEEEEEPVPQCPPYLEQWDDEEDRLVRLPTDCDSFSNGYFKPIEGAEEIDEEEEEEEIEKEEESSSSLSLMANGALREQTPAAVLAMLIRTGAFELSQMAIHTNVHTGEVFVIAITDAETARENELFDDLVADLSRPHGFNLLAWQYFQESHDLVVVLAQEQEQQQQQQQQEEDQQKNELELWENRGGEIQAIIEEE